MPTILRVTGYRLYFYANEGKEPPHIHVQYGSRTAKFWLEPVVVANNRGMNAKELKKAAKIVKDHENFIKGKWHAFFSKKN